VFRCAPERRGEMSFAARARNVRRATHQLRVLDEAWRNRANDGPADRMVISVELKPEVVVRLVSHHHFRPYLANRLIRKQGKANAVRKPNEKGAAGKPPPEGQEKLEHLPKAILSDSIEHRIILPNGS
jgi:hypothetical protein